jgi:hypothetical protein
MTNEVKEPKNPTETKPHLHTLEENSALKVSLDDEPCPDLVLFGAIAKARALANVISHKYWEETDDDDDVTELLSALRLELEIAVAVHSCPDCHARGIEPSKPTNPKKRKETTNDERRARQQSSRKND